MLMWWISLFSFSYHRICFSLYLFSYCFMFYLVFCSTCSVVYLVVHCFMLFRSLLIPVLCCFLAPDCLHLSPLPSLASPYSYLPRSCVPCHFLVGVLLCGSLTVSFHVASYRMFWFALPSLYFSVVVFFHWSSFCIWVLSLLPQRTGPRPLLTPTGTPTTNPNPGSAHLREPEVLKLSVPHHLSSTSLIILLIRS